MGIMPLDGNDLRRTSSCPVAKTSLGVPGVGQFDGVIAHRGRIHQTDIRHGLAVPYQFDLHVGSAREGDGCQRSRMSPLSRKRWCQPSASVSRCGVCLPALAAQARSK